ncbi:MAG TPA: S8 family serine peptidase, partial [Burkholderiaceae bacterium]|nr:S8 family serine peptidase [Burkholderiaceae bacterium]
MEAFMCSIRSKTRALAPLMLAALALLAGCGGGGDNTVTEEGTSLRGEESGGNPEAASDGAQAVMAERALSAAPFAQSAAAQPTEPGTPSVAQATQDDPLYATPVRTLDEAMASGRIRKEAVDAARKDGSVAVIVRLKLPQRFRPEGGMSNVEVEQQRLDIGNTQAALLDKIAGHKFSAVRRMRTIASMAMVADERTLETLVTLGEVARVSVDRLDVPHLANSTRVVGSNNVRNALGSAGSGTAVAILDTGLDKGHPFLTGRVVSEACFSGPNLYASNLCPGGSSGTYVGSGVPCVINLCDHGTHVAGIAAGRGGSGIAAFDGVAADASIISIQMASYYSGRICTDLGLPTPCPLFPLSNQIEALEHVLSLRNTFRIASVNMSLGAGYYTDQQK